jgi:hypothetical protein
MSSLSVRLPDSPHRFLKEMAEREGVSMNQFIALAVAEKVSALRTQDYLAARSARGSREAFEAAMTRVPDVEPEEMDRL